MNIGYLSQFGPCLGKTPLGLMPLFAVKDHNCGPDENWEGGNNYYIQTYLSFIQLESPKIVCNPKSIVFNLVGSIINFRNPELI
jgi:hypothetical protein